MFTQMLKITSFFRLRYAVFLAFLVGFIIRGFPEVLAGKWPLGFDTVTYYVPAIENWRNGNFNPVEFSYYVPLCYWLLYLAYYLSGNILLTIKTFGPLFYGFLSFSLFFFTTKGLNWSNKKGLLACIIFSSYFVSLRISWDLYRNMLGLAFLLLFLSFFKQQDRLSNKSKLTSSILATIVVLSHEITSAIMFTIIVGTFAFDIIERKKPVTKVLKSSLWFVPPLLVFLFIFLVAASQLATIPGSLNYFTSIDRGITYDSYQSLISDMLIVGLLCFGALLPFIIRGFWSERTLNLWLLVCLIGFLWPIAYPWFEMAPWNRWMYMLVPPSILYVVNAINRPYNSEITKKTSNHHKRKILSWKILLPIIVLGVSIFYILFPLIVSPYTVRASFFGPFERASVYIPGAFLSNTIPVAECGDLELCLKFVNSQLDNNSVLIAHESLRGWVSLYIDEDKNVINYRFSSHSEGLQNALAQGYEKVYLIWWADNLGWYNQTSVPAGFNQISTSGHIVVYLYQKE
jgi:hypothetical protein